MNKYFSAEDDNEDCCCCKWCEDCYKKNITKNNKNEQQLEINNKNIEKENNKDKEEENKEDENKEEEDKKKEEEISKEFTNTKTLLGHESNVTAITQLKSGKLATGGYDNTIRIWDIAKNEGDKIIKEDEKILVLLEFEENKLLSGTANNIHLWDLNSNSEIYEKSFEGHILWVMGLVKIDNKRFASASNDVHIKVWDYDSVECLMDLTEHTNCILSLVLLRNGKLCSGSADDSIKIWDIEKKECIQTLTGHEKWVRCVFELDNGIIVSGSQEGIKLWGLNKDNIDGEYVLLKTIKEHKNTVRTFCQVDEEHFASGSFDYTIKIWKINTWECVQTLDGHIDNIIGIIKLKKEGKQAIASCSSDKSIKIWEKELPKKEEEN